MFRVSSPPILSTVPRSGTWFLRYAISFLCHLDRGGRIDDRLTERTLGNPSGPGFDFHSFRGGPLFHVRGTLPDDHLFVSVLTNRDTGNPNPEKLTLKIAALVIGKPYRDPVAIMLPAEKLDNYVGEYQLNEKETAKILREEGKLMLSMSGGKIEITPSSETEFFSAAGRFTFIKEGGKITAMIWRNDYGIDQKAKRKEQP